MHVSDEYQWQYGNYEAATTYHYHDNILNFTHGKTTQQSSLLRKDHSYNNMRSTTVIYADMMIQNATDTTINDKWCIAYATYNIPHNPEIWVVYNTL